MTAPISNQREICKTRLILIFLNFQVSWYIQRPLFNKHQVLKRTEQLVPVVLTPLEKGLVKKEMTVKIVVFLVAVVKTMICQLPPWKSLLYFLGFQLLIERIGLQCPFPNWFGNCLKLKEFHLILTLLAKHRLMKGWKCLRIIKKTTRKFCMGTIIYTSDHLKASKVMPPTVMVL